MVVLDARRFDEYATMAIPGAVSVPGAELLRAQPGAGSEDADHRQLRRSHPQSHRHPVAEQRVDTAGLAVLAAEADRALYRFDVRTPEEYAADHIASFISAPGGQLVQETDMFAPVRGARIVLADDMGARADMTASWLAQMGWDVYTLAGGFDGALETGPGPQVSPRGPGGRYKRPYEGTDNPAAAMQAYLDWEFGLVDQLARDASHGFFVV